MSFAGISQSVITVLRNNKNLTLKGRKKKIRLGESTVSNSTLCFPTADKKTLEDIRKKHSLHFLRRSAILFLIFSLLFWLAYLVMWPYFTETYHLPRVYDEEKIELFESNGDQWFAHGGYGHSKSWYWKALNLQGGNVRIWKKFIYASAMGCEIDNFQCKEHQNLIRAIERIPFNPLKKEFHINQFQ